MNIDELRKIEFAKYDRAYQLEHYRMGKQRHIQAVEALQRCFDADQKVANYLDVGTGRGEMLRDAQRIGYRDTIGTEVVSSLIDGQIVRYAQAHALPFDESEYDVVSILDVLEHLVIGDEILALRECYRVARKFVIMTTNDRPSFNGEDDLHINKRPCDEWLLLMRECMPDAEVVFIDDRHRNATWLFLAMLK